MMEGSMGDRNRVAKRLWILPIICFALLTNARAQGLDTTDYFPLNVGDTYHYYESLPCPPSLSQPTFSAGYIVISDTMRVNGRKYFYVPGLYYGSDTVGVDDKGNLLYHYRGVDGIFYKFNASVGDTWQVSLPVVNGVPDTFVVTMQSRNDTVRVHAGTFTNCLRVFFDLPGSIDDEFWHWLAPGVGLVFHCVQEPRELYEANVNGVHYPGVTSVQKEPNVIGDFELYQNYPNPFNPGTVIRFDLETRGSVKLRILDVLGREVIELVNDIRGSGSYEVRWDGKDRAGRSVASGTYFCHLTFDHYQMWRKILLAR
jgi:hypothetical protein